MNNSGKNQTETTEIKVFVTHLKTEYDKLISGGCERFEARAMVREKVEITLEKWRSP
jgi:hypothetical protein